MKSLKKWALLLLGATVLAGQLYAQPSNQPQPAPTAAATPRLSPEEMRKDAQQMRNRVRADIQRVQHLQALARKEKDVIKLSCVNDKYIRLKAQANLFDEAHRELLGVLESNDRQPAYDRTLTAASDVRRAREEADLCVGVVELGADSANDFVGPDVIDDPTLYLPWDIQVEPPALASPYI